MLEHQLPSVPEVSPAEAVTMIEEGAMLLDVREPIEWESVRIDGAVLKPMSTIQDWWRDLPRDVDLIVQCRTGSRSASVTDALIRQGGLERVFNLAGGLVAWHSSGLPIRRQPASDEPPG